MLEDKYTDTYCSCNGSIVLLHAPRVTVMHVNCSQKVHACQTSVYLEEAHLSRESQRETRTILIALAVGR